MEAVLNTPSGRISLGVTGARIGSDTNNEIVLNDALAASIHAEITPVEDGHQITDLGSPQGVRVNGQALFPHTPQQLQNGDIIFIGSTSLIYKAITAETSSSSLFITDTKAEAIETVTGRELADQPTDTAMPAMPRVISRPLPSGPIELLEGDRHAITAEAAPTVASTAVPATPPPVIPGAASAYTLPSSPTPTAPGMQPEPQALPAQSWGSGLSPLTGLSASGRDPRHDLAARLSSKLLRVRRVRASRSVSGSAWRASKSARGPKARKNASLADRDYRRSTLTRCQQHLDLRPHTRDNP